MDVAARRWLGYSLHDVVFASLEPDPMAVSMPTTESDGGRADAEPKPEGRGGPVRPEPEGGALEATAPRRMLGILKETERGGAVRGEEVRRRKRGPGRDRCDEKDVSARLERKPG